MPDIKLLTKEEVDTLLRPQNRIDLGAYVGVLEQIQPGQWKAVMPDEGESHNTLKRRLTRAAKSLGKRVRYKAAFPDGRIPVTVAAR